MQSSLIDDRQTAQDPYANPWLSPDSMTGTTAASPSTVPTDPYAQAEASTTPLPYNGTTWGETTGAAIPRSGSGGVQTPTQPTYSPQPAGAAPYDAGASNYQSLMTQLNQAQDPQTQAIARDALSRQLQQDLEADGHTVKWNADGSMTVDGRPYEVGGASPTYSYDPSKASPNTGINGGGGMSSPVITSGGAGYTSPVNFDREGFRSDWMDPAAGNHTPEDLARLLQEHPEFAAGVHMLPGKGDKAVLVGKDGLWGTADDEPLDLVINAGLGGTGAGWTGPGGGGGAAAVGGPGGGPGGAGAPGFLSFNAASGGWVPGNNTSFDGLFDKLDPNAGGLPNYDQIYNSIAGADPNEAKTAALVGNILDHPESLDPTTVEMLKAKNAEELGMAQQQQDEELQHYGANNNILDSPWLAEQRANSAWGRRQATVESNRNIDITKAGQDAADRREAASLGQSYGQYRTSKVQAAINTAVEGTLGKLGEQRTRTQMNNAFAEAGKRLGMSADQLRLTYIQQNMGYDIDLKKLAEQSTEFQQDLAYRISALKQADDQFQANFQLNVDQFNHRRDQDYWERARTDRLDARPR
jgi:hypothetical protein